MDGFQGLSRSLQARLAAALSAAIVALALAGGALAYVEAYSEAIELQDDLLRQVAAVTRVPTAAQAAHATDDGESRLFVLVPGASRSDGLGLDARLADGLHTLELGGHTLRVAVRTRADGSRIGVAQDTRLRDEIARDGALRAVLPFALLVPVLLLLVVGLVRRMLRPVAELAQEADRRDAQALEPLPPRPVPSEIEPFVHAMNRLLARVRETLQAQRRFVADAAHELRTPMAALSVQAERLGAVVPQGEARERLAALREGLQRQRALLEQLLSLARAQSDGAPVAIGAAAEAVSVHGVFRRVLEDLAPVAELAGADIGIDGEADVMLRADALALYTVVRNLADNALIYGGAGVRVDLRVRRASDGAVGLEVEDDGPGIAPEERERVLDPFYRVLGTAASGSGLGLAIVHTLAQRLGATLSLRDANPAGPGRRGLCVRLHWRADTPAVTGAPEAAAGPGAAER